MKPRSDLFKLLSHIAYDPYVGHDEVERIIHRSENTEDVPCEVVKSKLLDPEGDFVRKELTDAFKQQ